jgi:DNA recombination protein RmuC
MRLVYNTLMEVLVGILIFVMILGFGAVLFMLSRKGSDAASDGSLAMLKQDLQGMSQLLSQTQSQMGERLDKNNDAMRDSIHRQMSESAKLITEVTERLTKLDDTNKRVVDVADELKTLQNVLQNPKQRGVLGEYYLDTVLKNVLPPDRYKLQYKFEDGEIVDAAIF